MQSGGGTIFKTRKQNFDRRMNESNIITRKKHLKIGKLV